MIRARMTEDNVLVVELWTPDGSLHLADIEIEDSGDARNRVIQLRFERLEGEIPKVRFEA